MSFSGEDGVFSCVGSPRWIFSLLISWLMFGECYLGYALLQTALCIYDIPLKLCATPWLQHLCVLLLCRSRAQFFKRHDSNLDAFWWLQYWMQLRRVFLSNKGNSLFGLINHGCFSQPRQAQYNIAIWEFGSVKPKVFSWCPPICSGRGLVSSSAFHLIGLDQFIHLSVTSFKPAMRESVKICIQAKKAYEVTKPVNPPGPWKGIRSLLVPFSCMCAAKYPYGMLLSLVYSLSCSIGILVAAGANRVCWR